MTLSLFTIVRYSALGVLTVVVLAGCQQKMADQPAHRPYEESTMFANKQSVRPLEPGVIHRNQKLSDDVMMTWLTPAGKSIKADEEWLKTVDPTGKTAPPPGAPTSNDNFVKEFPFALHEDDFKRGQVLYNANCALCHGGAGHANGKIPERGFLRPPSYHLDIKGEAKDWSTLTINKETGKPEPSYTGNPQGVSRGFYRYGKVQPLKDVNIGYIFQVITWGYGGMGSHETQIPDVADRWRVVAYVRALQLSQAANAAELPDDLKRSLDQPKSVAHAPGDKH